MKNEDSCWFLSYGSFLLGVWKKKHLMTLKYLFMFLAVSGIEFWTVVMLHFYMNICVSIWSVWVSILFELDWGWRETTTWGIKQEENIGKCLQQIKFRICLELKEGWWKESMNKVFGSGVDWHCRSFTAQTKTCVTMWHRIALSQVKNKWIMSNDTAFCNTF